MSLHLGGIFSSGSDIVAGAQVARGLKTAAFSQLAKASLARPFQIGAPGGGPARNATEIMG